MGLPSGIVRVAALRSSGVARCALLLLLSLLLPAGISAGEQVEGEREYSKAAIKILENRIEKLRERHDQLLIRGEADDQLKTTIRQLLETRRAGDWAAVEEKGTVTITATRGVRSC